jgi:hypothetical protein
VQVANGAIGAISERRVTVTERQADMGIVQIAIIVLVALAALLVDYLTNIKAG